jgi:hypothetical protein
MHCLRGAVCTRQCVRLLLLQLPTRGQGRHLVSGLLMCA